MTYTYVGPKGIFAIDSVLKWALETYPIQRIPYHNRSYPNNFIVESAIWCYALFTKRKVEGDFAIKGKKSGISAYPTVASACYLPIMWPMLAFDYCGQHHKIFSSIFMRHVQNILDATPYDKSDVTGCKNRVGNCAEQHVADYVLATPMFVHNNCAISDLKFSYAIRPRTLLRMDPCSNCSALFPQCKVIQYR